MSANCVECEDNSEVAEMSEMGVEMVQRVNELTPVCVVDLCLY